ncbi:DNA topoisomerase VI subunit B [Candidatus Woesearchaeota archaeon]|nr:DNA topoisomerase VI subunit B [Candidatus Woesearchaeota archaeon]MBW3005674.1 DNA topoisomerase VI subunit B [Candidatus Woesearchaeota archaeon]
MTKEPVAVELAKKQKAVSVAEFFERNRHLLGFDNKRKALLTVVKEAVDNAIDACEEARTLPEINVQILDMGNDRFRVVVEDNGPGIVKKQVPNIFAKLLYGSKFHTLKQARGQQGIGISAAVLYSQLTTGRPAKIKSRIDEKHDAMLFELKIDTKNNKPEIIKEEKIEWKKPRGTRIELDLEASYQKGDQSVDTYIKETAIVNPHTTIIYTNPKAEQFVFPRATDKLPEEPKEIKPHPYGVELGILIKMIKDTEARTLQAFLTKEFCRVGTGTAKEICEKAAIPPNTKPRDINHAQAEKLMEGIKNTKIISPSTDCIVPIGSELLEKGLKKEINAEFYTAVTRSPSVYRGNPFVIECAIAYGGEQPKDGSIRLMRFANRVPLLYQQSAGAIFKGVTQTSWRSYGLSQSNGSLPQGPVTLVVHLASVWPPFTSEAKEALAHYPEIIKEIKLALQECGRKLGMYVNKKKRIHAESQKRSYIEKYIPHVAEALKELLALTKTDEAKVEQLLKDLLEKHRGKIKKVEMENTEYDEEFAKIGKEEKE